MPTKEWMQNRRQITFWVSKEEKQEFSAACQAAGRTETEVLRETVQTMLLLTHNGGKARG